MFTAKEDGALKYEDILCFFVVDASNKSYYLPYRRFGRLRLSIRHRKQNLLWWLTGNLKYR